MALYRLGRVEEACIALEKAQTIAPADRTTIGLLAMCRHSEGGTDEASGLRDQLEALVANDPVAVPDDFDLLKEVKETLRAPGGP
jgi:Flp pilus assembly protein TadD